MRTISNLLFCVGLIFIFGCGDGNKSENDITNNITGKWDLNSFEVTVKVSENEMKLEGNKTNMRDIGGYNANTTIFLPTGQYEETYWLDNDSIMFQPSGNWKDNGDSVLILQNDPSEAVQAFLVKFKGDTMTFSGMVDWDQDGESDDEYHGTYIKLGEI